MKKKQILYGCFSDSVRFDSDSKRAISVRDGVLEYLGAEIGMEPSDKIFTVYRSPATIANAARMMDGIPLTDEHVSLDETPSNPIGTVKDSRMVDFFDEATSSYVAVENGIEFNDSNLAPEVTKNKPELSLGYRGELHPHDKFDFEQRNIIPHHLASVPSGRCGSSCSFIDSKPPTIEVLEMSKRKQPAAKKATAQAVESALLAHFTDAEGAPNLEQIIEIVQGLPDAFRKLSIEQMNEVLPSLMKIKEIASDSGADVSQMSDAEDEEEVTDGDYEDEEKEQVAMEDSAKFKDAVAAAHLAGQKELASVIDRARNFLDEDYQFAGKTAKQIMRDTVELEHGKTQFTDAELSVAFKMMKSVSSVHNFGDASTGNSLADRVAAQLKGE